MNPFVDYQKRSTGLPEGSKDLIDVLQLARATAEQPPEPPPKGLADIEQYLFRLLASAAKFRSLWIDGDRASLIALFCDDGGLRTLVLVDAEREQAVRGVFPDSGISPTQDDPVSSNGPCSRALMYPLPLAASGAAQFVRKLLTKGLGLAEDVALEFGYREKIAA